MSFLTNTSAISALQTLRALDDNLSATQNRISSGLRVGSAADNASYWSIATTMRSDNAALSTVSDALGLAAAKTDTAYAGLNAAMDIVTAINSKLVSAREPGVDRDKVNVELTELKKQLTTIAQSASFGKENWLYNTSTTAVGTKQMVGSFQRAADGTVSVLTIDYNAANSVLIDTKTVKNGLLTKATTVTQPNGATTTTASYYLVAVAGASGVTGSEIKISSTTTDNNLTGMIAATSAILSAMTDSAASLGAVGSSVTRQSEFIHTLTDVVTKGIGRLVDADMNEESTRLKALQTQQQLAIQSLSIANAASQSVLQLFR